MQYIFPVKKLLQVQIHFLPFPLPLSAEMSCLFGATPFV